MEVRTFLPKRGGKPAYEIRFDRTRPGPKGETYFRRRYYCSKEHAERLGDVLKEAEREGRLDEALAMAEQVEADNARPANGITFAEFADRWFEESVLGHKNKRKKPNSTRCRKQRRSQLDCHLLPALGILPLKRIEGPVIEERVLKPLQELHAHRHPDDPNGGSHNINNVRITLHALFQRAVKNELVSRNPVDDVEWPAPPDGEQDFYDVEESDRFLAAAWKYEGAEYWYPLFFLALRTGICEGELFGAEVDDLKLGAAQPHKIHVRQQVQEGEECEPKWSRRRWPDLDDDVVRVMRGYLEWRKHRFPNSKWLFPSLSTGDVVRFPSHYVARPLHDIAAMAGVKAITFHELRHSRGSQLAIVESDRRVIEEQLGHRPGCKTVERYIHMASGRGAKAAAEVAKLSKAPLPPEIVRLADYCDAKDQPPPVKRLAVPEEQQRVLNALVRKPLTIPELTVKLGVLKKRVHRLLEILEHAGLVHKSRIEGQKFGTKLVMLTDAGRDAIEHDMARIVEPDVIAPRKEALR
jgi:integrase/DNA-binding MarR family transcriptional regulator